MNSRSPSADSKRTPLSRERTVIGSARITGTDMAFPTIDLMLACFSPMNLGHRRPWFCTPLGYSYGVLGRLSNSPGVCRMSGRSRCLSNIPPTALRRRSQRSNSLLRDYHPSGVFPSFDRQSFLLRLLLSAYALCAFGNGSPAPLDRGCYLWALPQWAQAIRVGLPTRL